MEHWREACWGKQGSLENHFTSETPSLQFSTHLVLVVHRPQVVFLAPHFYFAADLLADQTHRQHSPLGVNPETRWGLLGALGSSLSEGSPTRDREEAQ